MMKIETCSVKGFEIDAFHQHYLNPIQKLLWFPICKPRITLSLYHTHNNTTYIITILIISITIFLLSHFIYNLLFLQNFVQYWKNGKVRWWMSLFSRLCFLKLSCSKIISRSWNFSRFNPLSSTLTLNPHPHSSSSS